MSNRSAVVVGGGISGILSALLLKRQFERVTLIEKTDQLGGLLRSYVNEFGTAFDYGTHFLRETGIGELDQILFGRVREENWHSLRSLKAGNFFSGRLNEQSPYPDLRLLPSDLYQRGMVELLSFGPPEGYAHLEEQLRGYFGNTFTQEVMAPALKKFTGYPLKELAPDAHRLFGLERVVGLTPFASNELKKSEILDAKLAFHHSSQRVSDCRYFYPRCGGIGQWVEHLTQQLKQQGVEILTHSTVERIQTNQTQVTSIRLGNGKTLECDTLVWTVPVAWCLRASGVNLSSAPPAIRMTSLYHFTFDEPFQTPLEYVNCFDDAFSTFRITLYSNIGGPQTKRTDHSLTVEVFSDDIPDLDWMLEEVGRELHEMHLVSPSAKVLYRKALAVRDGFPIPTPQLINQAKDQLREAKQLFKNVCFLGKASGTSFFMQEVLTQTYHTIQALRPRVKLRPATASPLGASSGEFESTLQMSPLAPETTEEWNRFCERTEEAHFGHTTWFLNYQAHLRPQNGTRPLHFFVHRQGQVVAICPLALETMTGETSSFESFSIGGEFIPAPALDAALAPSERERILKLIFREMERLAQHHRVAKASFHSHPFGLKEFAGSLPAGNSLIRYGFLDASIQTQILDLTKTQEQLWHGIRKSYRPLIHQADRRFELRVVDERNPDFDQFEEYRNGHHKAAGRVTRPLETFQMMFDWIRAGKALLLQAIHQDRVEGSVLILAYKQRALYASGWVDPDLPKQIAATHWLQWEAIKLLQERGVRHFEIGWQLFNPQWSYQPTPEEVNIAFFKRGMGGQTVALHRGEKYFDPDFFEQEMRQRLGILRRHQERVYSKNGAAEKLFTPVG